MAGAASLTETYITAATLAAETAAWLDEIGAYQWRELPPLVPAEAALLVVDMTKPFVDGNRPLASPNAGVILPLVAAMVNAFRQASRPILWIVQGHHSVMHDRGERLAAWWPSPILEGTDDVAIATGLSAAPDEKVIIKRRYSGFYQTDLEVTLRCLGVSQVVVCGVLTHVCPFTTAFDAFTRDFGVYYPADGTASLNRELHVGALRAVAGWCGHVVHSRQIVDWL